MRHRYFRLRGQPLGGSFYLGGVQRLRLWVHTSGLLERRELPGYPPLWKGGYRRQCTKCIYRPL